MTIQEKSSSRSARTAGPDKARIKNFPLKDDERKTTNKDSSWELLKVRAQRRGIPRRKAGTGKPFVCCNTLA